MWLAVRCFAVTSTPADPSADRASNGEGRVAAAWPWVLRAVWFLLPFSVGSSFGDALSTRSAPVRLTALGLAWVWWGLGLLSTLVPHPIGLVIIRVCAPLAFVVAVWATTTGVAYSAVSGFGLAVSVVVCALSFSANTGHLYVNGPAYPNERRYLLRPPALLLLGPIPLAGAAAASGTVLGPLLVASGAWVFGGLAFAVGVAAAFVAARALYVFTRRFLVFVPAGFVVHDFESLRDPVLFKRQTIEGIRAAAVDSDSLDLTAKAPGLTIEVLLREKVEITKVRNSRDTGEVGKTARFLVVPSMPGRFLTAAAKRRYPTGPR